MPRSANPDRSKRHLDLRFAREALARGVGSRSKDVLRGQGDKGHHDIALRDGKTGRGGREKERKKDSKKPCAARRSLRFGATVAMLSEWWRWQKQSETLSPPGTWAPTGWTHPSKRPVVTMRWQRRGHVGWYLTALTRIHHGRCTGRGVR